MEANKKTPYFGCWKRERKVLIFLNVFFYGLYIPATHFAIGLSPVDVSLPLDGMIPLVPETMFFYGMIYPMACLPLFVVRDPLLFRQVTKAYLCLETCALLCFILVPVHMTLRPSIQSVLENDFWSWTLKFCYWLDQPSGCFPSLHVGASILSALCCLSAHRPTGIWAFGLAILISLSTLTVRQHYIADVLLGLLIAGFCYLFFVCRAERLTERRTRFDYRTVAPPVVGFTLMLVGFYSMYFVNMQPWS